MNTKNQRQIVLFFQGIDGIKRHEWTHGTLYLKLEDDRDCDFIHAEIRKFCKGCINPEGGVNMYAVGDEFAFDFVEGDKDNYVGETDDADSITGIFKGDTWYPSKDVEPLDSIADTMMNLEADSKEGR